MTGHFEYKAASSQTIPLIIEGAEIGWLDNVTICVIDDGPEYEPVFDWFFVEGHDGSKLWNLPEFQESVNDWLNKWWLDDYEKDVYWEKYNDWKATFHD